MTVTVVDECPEYIIEIDRVLTTRQIAVMREVWAWHYNVPEHWQPREASGTPYPRLRALGA